MHTASRPTRTPARTEARPGLSSQFAHDNPRPTSRPSRVSPPARRKRRSHTRPPPPPHRHHRGPLSASSEATGRRPTPRRIPRGLPRPARHRGAPRDRQRPLHLPRGHVLAHPRSRPSVPRRHPPTLHRHPHAPRARREPRGRHAQRPLLPRHRNDRPRWRRRDRLPRRRRPLRGRRRWRAHLARARAVPRRVPARGGWCARRADRGCALPRRPRPRHLQRPHLRRAAARRARDHATAAAPASGASGSSICSARRALPTGGCSPTASSARSSSTCSA